MSEHLKHQTRLVSVNNMNKTLVYKCIPCNKLVEIEADAFTLRFAGELLFNKHLMEKQS